MSAIVDAKQLSGLRDRGTRPLCLFSGGLDSAYLLNLLAQHGFHDVLALNVFLGGCDAPDRGERLCHELGIEYLQIDRREEFAEGYVLPAIAASALYLGRHPISASLSRPLIARAAVETARSRGCNAIFHTSTRSQNSLRRFNGAIASLGFDGLFGSIFEDTAISRQDKIAKLAEWGYSEYRSRVLSVDDNLWGRCVESGVLDDPEDVAPTEGLFTCPAASSEGGLDLTIDIRRGRPVALDGEDCDLVDLIERLRAVGERCRLGRYIGLEEVGNGAKVQECHEMAAGAILFDAFRRVESGCLSDACIREKMGIAQVWVREAVEGRWFGPLRRAAQAFLFDMASEVSGTVRYRVSDKSLDLVALISERPLYIRSRQQLESGVGACPVTDVAAPSVVRA